jgi:hypothetical protein
MSSSAAAAAVEAAEFMLARERRCVTLSTSAGFAVNRDQLDNAVRLSFQRTAHNG